MPYVVGIDIGGTFTDSVILSDAGQLTFAKAFSTPPDFSQGIVDSLQTAAESLGVPLDAVLEHCYLLLHSTTVADNALVTGNLAVAGLLTTSGFETTLLATRGGYGRWSGLTEDEKRNPINTDKPPTIVPLSMIRGIRERIDAHGNVLAEPDDASIERALEELLEAGAEALAICFLWSFSNPQNERKVRDVVKILAPHLFITVSHEIAPILGEYERTSTVALNARLGPVLHGYLRSLQTKLADHGFRGQLLVMQAHGGVVNADEASSTPVGVIESGPVSGLAGSKNLGESLGCQSIIATDMGGTTFKVGVVRDGLVEYQREPMVIRYHYALPKLDVTSLGIAGGSIIRVDRRTNTPRVGPESAGSYPGPVCYDHGGDEPTVTDVDAILGYLNSDYFVGGRAKLNTDEATSVFKRKIADPLDMSVAQAAAAIYRLTNSMIYDLLHKVTVQRGLDPRKFALFAYGGTAGMHAVSYGGRLGVREIVIPNAAGVQGAFGLVTSDVVHEYQQTRPLRMPVKVESLNATFEALIRQATAQLDNEGFRPDEIGITRFLDMRYRRQVHVITTPVPGAQRLTASAVHDVTARFERLYEERYGPESAYREAGIEVVAFRVRASGSLRKPRLPKFELKRREAINAFVESRTVWVEEANRFEPVRGYDFEQVSPGNFVRGPAIIWTPVTTVVLGRDKTARMDGYRNLRIGMGSDRR